MRAIYTSLCSSTADRLASRGERGRQPIELISKLIGPLEFKDIDLVILTDTPPLLAREIIRRGSLLHAIDPEMVRGFERDFQLRAADVEPFIQRGRARLLEAL